MNIIINCGHAALDNGAIGPLTAMYKIAEVADTTVSAGEYYGSDMIDVSEENLPVVIELLEEACLLYRFFDDPLVWRGVKTGSHAETRQHNQHWNGIPQNGNV